VNFAAYPTKTHGPIDDFFIIASVDYRSFELVEQIQMERPPTPHKDMVKIQQGDGESYPLHVKKYEGLLQG
jgi:hypothetical protein